MQFTDQEIETIKSLLLDHGSDCPDTDSDAVQALGEKLGVREPIQPPSAEELKRREEYAKSPAGKMMNELIATTINNMARNLANDIFTTPKLINQIGSDGVKSTLRIRLPNDYTVKAE